MGEKVKIAVQWLRDLRQVQVRAPTCAIYPIFQVSGWVRHSSLLDGGTWGGHRSPSVTSGGIDKGRVLSHKSRLIEFFRIHPCLCWVALESEITGLSFSRCQVSKK